MKLYEGNKTREISFPLGGIGTGCIGLSGNGLLTDWEIFNSPNKGSSNGYSHFAVRAEDENGKIISKVLCGDVLKDYMGQYSKASGSGYGFGVDGSRMQGFPHFSKWDFTSDFPFATLRFQQEDFPAVVTLRAFNPFIPMEEDLSGIPAAFFTVGFENKTEKNYRFSASLSVHRPFSGTNTPTTLRGCPGVFMQSDAEKDTVSYRDMTILGLDGETRVQPDWYRGGWQDSIVTFWKEFSENETLQSRRYDGVTRASTATVCSEVSVGARGFSSLRFLLAWNAPNRINDWDRKDGQPVSNEIWKNYYAVKWENSLESASFSAENWKMLESGSMEFAMIMNANTLPEEVNETAVRNLSVLKSPTVLRLEDGSLWGWEGVSEQEGSCPGSCTHVWNYAYALCFLFPGLERSLRENAVKYNLHDNGKMGFRVRLPLGTGKELKPCVDGQMGEVIKTYREWKLSGDDRWLEKMWPYTKKALEYAWVDDGEFSWDADQDGILEGRQHHTLDMELFGPNGWLQGFYLLALKAAAEMAAYLGDYASAKTYEKLFKNGSEYTEKELFNGSYYIQKVDITDKSLTEKFNVSHIYWNEETGEIKYQIKDGCEIDQLVAQWHSNLCGLGDIFDRDHRKTALESLYRNNFKSTMRNHTNPWRIFAVNDEAGTVMCDYPAGTRRPQIPIPYCEECMAGFEYALAGLMISEGMRSEGLELVRALYNRYDGEKRNPFNEIECGGNYARSMASFALLPIMSGFAFDLTKKEMGFAPVIHQDSFSCFWACGAAWGRVTVRDREITVTVAGGKLKLRTFLTDKAEAVKTVLCDDTEIRGFSAEKGRVVFRQELAASKTLKLVF